MQMGIECCIYIYIIHIFTYVFKYVNIYIYICIYLCIYIQAKSFEPAYLGVLYTIYQLS